MGKVLFKGKKNNSGSTIVIVLLMTSFVLILSTLITTTTMINLRMKMASSQSTKSFYTAEQAVDEVRAALGVISVECFNTAYEEELTKLYSTNSTGTTINNKEANQQMRQKYTKDLLNKMQLFEGVPSSDAKIAFYLGQPAGSFTIANWNADDTKADEIAMMSCKAAVKGNDKLSYSEAQALIQELLKLEDPFTCPHGRPTIIKMSKYELEKKFKRIQD